MTWAIGAKSCPCTLQLDLADHSRDLLAIDVDDRRLATLPAAYLRLLDDTAMLRIGLPGGLSLGELARSDAAAPYFAAGCERLAVFGVPETIDHSEFHDGNVLVQQGHYRFIDWGDACVSHPFLSLFVTLRSLARTMGLETKDPAVSDLLG